MKMSAKKKPPLVVPDVDENDSGVYAVRWVNALGKEGWQSRLPETGERRWYAGGMMDWPYWSVEPGQEGDKPWLLLDRDEAIAVAKGFVRVLKQNAWTTDWVEPPLGDVKEET